MRYHNITKADLLNGAGLRVFLWLAGCSHHCQACQNPITWNPNDGLVLDDEANKEVFDELEKDWCSGITFSGGDPLYLGNREGVSSLVSEIRSKFPDKNIWCYTGYTWEELMEQMKDDDNLRNILDNVDVLLEGRFVLGLALEKLHYVGSSNQRIIDVKKSLDSNEINLYIDNSNILRGEV